MTMGAILGRASALQAREQALFASVMKTPRGAGMRVQAASDMPELLVFGVVGWDVLAEDVVRALDAIDAPSVRVRINSGGGSFFEGLGIYNALKVHPARIEARVEGLAASAASFIAMAGDEIAMGSASWMMIHQAWVLAIGNATELRDLADWLDRVDAMQAQIYARRTGEDAEAVKGLLAAETWMTGAEAVEAGFAERLFDDDAGEDAAVAALGRLNDLAALAADRYARRPEGLASGMQDAAAPAAWARRAERALTQDAGCTRTEARAAIAAIRARRATPDAGADADLLESVRRVSSLIKV
jgi:ATP-dependent protease ClpP protease subunit